jgi:hypothetical protein
MATRSPNPDNRPAAHPASAAGHGPERTFSAVAAALLREGDVDEGTGFGTNPGLRPSGKVFAMLVGSELVVKLPADRCAEMVAAGSARVFEVGRRRMREWVRIADVDETTWRTLTQQARSYVAG